MDFQKALRILGLNSNFTEEELKKAHRELANKYHPDRNKSPEAEAKMKDINEARDYLLKHIKSNNRNNQTNYNPYNYNRYGTRDDIEEYIAKKYQELKKIVDFNFNKYKLSGYIYFVILKIKYKLDEFESVTNITNNKELIDNAFKAALRKIKDHFREIKDKFYQENNINETDVKEPINYDCTLTEFYEQLLKIKDKYEKERIIQKKLEEETLKYQTYSGYDKLEILIKQCIKNLLIEIRNNGYIYTQQDIDNMHQSILECFETYYSIKQKIDELGEITAKIDDQEINNQYKNIKSMFEQGTCFADIEESIKKLEELIDKYKKENQKQILFKKSEEAINEIYRELITRYSNAIKNYNIVSSYESINNLNIFFKETLQVFAKGCIECQKIEYFNLFNKITFKNIDEDSKILKTIIEQTKTTNKTNIYIKLKCNDTLDESSFFMLDEEKMIMYKVGTLAIFDGPIVSYKKIDNETLQNEYISLEEFLDKGAFIGKRRRKLFNDKTITILYEMNGIIIYLSNDIIVIAKKQILELSLSTVVDDKTVADIEKYKDKDYVLSQIKKRIEAIVKNYKKNNPILTTHNYSNNNNKETDKPKKFFDSYYDFFDEPKYNTDDEPTVPFRKRRK